MLSYINTEVGDKERGKWSLCSAESTQSNSVCIRVPAAATLVYNS
jgi:hypothetical protein